jgi:hypothetical protein
MASTIKLKNGSGAPTTGDLVQGEPALDLTNKRLYTENASGVVIEVGTSPSTIDINAGTIDGTVIGGSTAAAGTFTTGQFNTSLNVDGTTNLDVVDIDGAVDMASTLTVGGTTNDGTTLAQIVQSGTGRAFSVNRNVASATRAVVNLAQLQASGGAEAVLDIQQTTQASRAIKVTPDGSIDRFSVYGTGALVTTPVAGGHAVFNEGGADADFRVESATTANALFVEGSSGNVGIGTSSPQEKTHSVGRILSTTQYGSPTQRIGTSIGENGNTRADIDFRRWTGAAANHGVGMIEVADTGVMAFYTDTKTSNTPATTERMRIDASGNVGIGETSPSTFGKLVVTGSTPFAVLRSSDVTTAGFSMLVNGGSNGVGSIATDDGGHLTFDTGATGAGQAERMRIDSSGNVGIGTSSPTNKLDVSGAAIRLTNGTNATAQMVFGPTAISDDYAYLAWDNTIGSENLNIYTDGGIIKFSANAAERMRIDSSGNLIVGTTSSAGKLTVRLDSTTASPLFIVNAAISGKFATFEGNGAVHGSITWSGSTTSYNTSSDQRLKENIADADDAGNKIDAIQVRKFDWKADGSHQDYGMIAQELQTVAPEAVSGDADSEEMMGVDYSKLVPMLIKEIQSLRNRVAQLEE